MVIGQAHGSRLLGVVIGGGGGASDVAMGEAKYKGVSQK